MKLPLTLLLFCSAAFPAAAASGTVGSAQLVLVRDGVIESPLRAQWPADMLPWLAMLQTETIRDELAAVVAMDARVGGLFQPNWDPSSISNRSGDWESLSLLNKGRVQRAGCEVAAETCAVLRRLGHYLKPRPPAAAEVGVRILKLMPNAKLRPHHGPGGRLVAHLGIKIPTGSSLTLDGDKLQWQEGEWLVFDDSFLHSAENLAQEPRYILHVTFPHPDLVPPMQPPAPPVPPPPATPCPCKDASLCKPLSPQPPIQDEIVAFSSWIFNIDHPSSVHNRDNYTAPLLFDWSKITTYAPFDQLSPRWTGNASNTDMYSDLWCTAHENKARILDWGYKNAEGVGCPVTRFYGWARDRNGNKSNLEMFNQTAVLAWADEVATCIPEKGFDGVLLDQEGIDVDFNETEKEAITFAVCALKQALNKTLPGNMVAWTTDVGAYFDYATMTSQGCVDLWLDMAYQWCVDYEAHSETRNRAPTPLAFIDEIVETYETKFKVPSSKLGVVFPWYGCSFECEGEGDAYGGCPRTPTTANAWWPPLYGNLDA